MDVICVLPAPRKTKNGGTVHESQLDLNVIEWISHQRNARSSHTEIWNHHHIPSMMNLTLCAVFFARVANVIQTVVLQTAWNIVGWATNPMAATAFACYHLRINMRTVSHSIIFHKCTVNCYKYPSASHFTHTHTGEWDSGYDCLIKRHESPWPFKFDENSI